MSAYSVGHFLNDLCASAWFTYVLYYVKRVQSLDDFLAGYGNLLHDRLVMLSGLLADGMTTPIVGIFSDHTHTKCGKRTPWYIVGTIMVVPSFYFIFNGCILCDALPDDVSPRTYRAT